MPILHLQSVWTWADYLNLLNLSCLICKMGPRQVGPQVCNNVPSLLAEILYWLNFFFFLREAEPWFRQRPSAFPLLSQVISLFHPAKHYSVVKLSLLSLNWVPTFHWEFLLDFISNDVLAPLTGCDFELLPLWPVPWLNSAHRRVVRINEIIYGACSIRMAIIIIDG